jgi:hypothetical protein
MTTEPEAAPLCLCGHAGWCHYNGTGSCVRCLCTSHRPSVLA